MNASGSEVAEGSSADAIEITIDPFARHRAFASWVRTGKLRSSVMVFLATRPEPIDVRADKILDLTHFGKPMNTFLKTPRPKRNDEYPEGYEDRLKRDVERQFILRNLMRYVKTINKGDPLEFEKKKVGLKLDLDTRANLKDLHRKAELLEDLGVERAKNDLAWRHRFLEVMQWEQYFCKEIKDDFDGPLWKHDPVTNPVRLKHTVDDVKPAEVTNADADNGGEGGGA